MSGSYYNEKELKDMFDGALKKNLDKYKQRVKEVIKKLEPKDMMSIEAQCYWEALRDIKKELGLKDEEV